MMLASILPTADEVQEASSFGYWFGSALLWSAVFGLIYLVIRLVVDLSAFSREEADREAEAKSLSSKVYEVGFFRLTPKQIGSCAALPLGVTALMMAMPFIEQAVMGRTSSPWGVIIIVAVAALLIWKLWPKAKRMVTEKK
jgi:hypothetical protein